MANITPSWVQTNPSYVLPELLIQFQQASGAFETLATGAPMVRLGDGDLVVYAKRLNIRSQAAAGQTAYNSLPSATIDAHMLQTPTYLMRARAEYDHHDTAAAARWGIGITEAQRLAMRQAHYQLSRDALLYGFNPQNGEGLLNTPEATRVTLPADENGNTNVASYSANSMFKFLLAEIQGLKTRTMQLGQGRKIVICGPQRILGALEYQSIIELTSFQRTGAGSDAVRGGIQDILSRNGDTLEWVYDDTLIGKGDGGTDAVIVTMPEVNKPKVMNKFNTNVFAELSPSLLANNLQLTDVAAPIEIPTPIPGGAIDIVSEMRITSGWCLRPEGLTIVSMPYSA